MERTNVVLNCQTDAMDIHMDIHILVCSIGTNWNIRNRFINITNLNKSVIFYLQYYKVINIILKEFFLFIN